MTKNDKARAARMTREDIEAAVRELCIASVRLDEQQALMNLELAAVRERYEPELAALSVTVDKQETTIRAWADTHPEEFAISEGPCGGKIKTPLGPQSSDPL